jgi:hypothetical protein
LLISQVLQETMQVSMLCILLFFSGSCLKTEVFKQLYYKEFVHNNSDFQDIKNITLKDWHYLSAINIQRAYCLVNNEYKVV